jgi:hypothetical protein
VQVSTSLVVAYEDYSHFGEVGSIMEQRAVIKFCVKLKKTATVMFETLRSVYGE